MSNAILDSYVKDFSSKHELENKDESSLFEYFVNFSIISKFYPREIEDVLELSTGGGDDTGIDGCAIIVNGNIISTEEEIDDLIKRNASLDVKFIFIQSKKKSKFESDKVGTFIFGVKCFFMEKKVIEENEKISKLKRIKDKIYDNSIYFSDKPELWLYYVTTGKWKGPSGIINRANSELESLDLTLFKSAPNIEFYDSDKLELAYKEISRKSIKEAYFPNSIPLPDLPESIGVTQSIIGSMAIKDYITLISDSDGNIMRSLFFDNIRDFQGNNKVNKEIAETLQEKELQYLLPLLNNGITIIAKNTDRTGHKIRLTDFQIVNGCQSSYILFNNKEKINDSACIVVKIIETNNQEVISKIIRATNRQTEVKDEAFESLKPFHKKLEEFYYAQTKNSPYPIYYERRSKEYLDNSKVKPYQVITLACQVKCYISTVLEQPQSTHRYFGELLESNGSKIFSNNSMLIHYYLSAFIFNRLESMIKNSRFQPIHRMFKYHILFLVYQAIKHNYEIKDDLICKINSELLIELFLKANNVIKLFVKGEYRNISYSDLVRNKDFTQKIKNRLLTED